MIAVVAWCLLLAVVAWWTRPEAGRPPAPPSPDQRTTTARRRANTVRAVVPVVDVVRLGLAAGLRPPAAFDLAARQLALAGVEDAGALGAARVGLERGEPFPDAVRGWAEAVGAPADELADLLVASHASGATVVPALDRLARDLRRRHRQRAQERARRLPVLMVVPLVLFVLPAFGLLAVVPMLAVGLDAVRSTAV